MNIYFELFFIFTQIGFLTFGGGMAMLPVMQQILIQRGLMTVQETIDMVAISQMTPGPFAVNAATFTGVKIAGIWGAAAATLGVMMPSLVITSVVAYYFFRFKESEIVKSAMRGIRPVIPALIFAAMWGMGEASLKDALTIAIAAVSCVLVVKKINPVWVILGAGLLGVVVFR
ncbi:MAG: chromate transporter [Oscillospiraceae bacterium]|nr:chromate transporter [Oscillospiraceae bacterium]